MKINCLGGERRRTLNPDVGLGLLVDLKVRV